jgi:hypothetical protein
MEGTRVAERIFAKVGENGRMTEYCSVLSEAAGVPLVATAPEETTAWLLLEFNGAWPSKILDGPALPAPVVARLAALEERLPEARVQFIRRPRRAGPPVVFFGRPEGLHRLELASYEALLDLDLEAILGGTAPAPGMPAPGPLFLVCVHARRDACCALRGGATYRALERAAPGDVWQTSHLGGHRFAPTIVALPLGLYLGRAGPDEAAGVVADVRAGRLPPLEYVRGRAGVDPAAQAAEHFLREASGERALDAVRVVAVDALDEKRWRVTLAHRDAARTLEVALELGPPDLPASCGKKPAPTARYRLSEA